MSMHSARLSYGANMGLGRMHCRSCNTETLHKTARCVHCGTAHEVVIPPNLSTAERRVQIDSRNYQLAQARKRGNRRVSIAP